MRLQVGAVAQQRMCCAIVLLLGLSTTSAKVLSNDRWVLKQRPVGDFTAQDLVMQTEEVDDASLDKDEVLVQVETLSIEAFYRTTLDEEAYHGSTAVGAVVPALGIGRVVSSKSRKLKPGSLVVGMLGAQSLAKLPAAGLQAAASLPGSKRTDSLGRLGISGLTAWIGMCAVLGPPKRGQVVIVSAAAGAVGSLAAQIAKARGAIVIGVAGGAAKCAYLRDRLKLDGAIDYKEDEVSLAEQIDRVAPDGIDFFFDNVGGPILDAVLSRLRRNARIVLCGGIHHYGSGDMNKGRVVGPREYLKLAERGATMRGYNVMHHLPAKLPAFLAKMLWLIWRGKVLMDEHVEQGLERFADAMELMYKGGHVGKLLVNVSAPA